MTNMQIWTMIAALILCALLSACGQKGDLYFPPVEVPVYEEEANKDQPKENS